MNESAQEAPVTVPRVELGKTGIEISSIGVGTWQWGDGFYWGYGKGYAENDIAEAYAVCRDAGLNFFDTAEIYGRGKSERLLGALVQSDGWPDPPVVTTKFLPFPWRLARWQLRRALRGSLERLGMETVDLYLVHQPLPPRGVEVWAEEIGEAVHSGRVRAAGVSNYNVDRTRRAHAALEQRGIPLAANQVGFSLLNRGPERSGLLDVCRELGVTVVAYGPLGEGLLTGKYTVQNPPPLVRRLRYARKWLARIPGLIDLMTEIGTGHEAAPSQVAINWIRAKGVVPLAGIKDSTQARDIVAAARWNLTPDEVAALDRAADAL